jgi:hypothetical protein
MRKITPLVALSILVIAGCAQVGSVVLKLMTAKEKDLSKMAIVGTYNTNLYPKAVETLSVNYAKNWEDGGSAVAVQLIKTEGYGFLQLDGDVLINGDTAKYESGGVYMVFVDKNDRSPKKVELISKSGQKAHFEIAPAPTFSIKSINGKTSEAQIDVTKDLVLEFNLPREAKGKLMLVSLISSFPGGKDFNNFQSFYASEKVVIPAGSFKSTQISGGDLMGKNVVDYVKENQWLKVELVEESRAELTPFPYFRKKSVCIDTKPVSITGELESYAYYRTKGEIDVKEDEKPLKYEGSVMQGYYAPSLEVPKLRIGIASLGVYADIYKQDKSESRSKVGDVEYITTTITTYQFPKLDDVYWDEYMGGIYADFKKILESYGVEVVDIDKIMNDPNYARFYDVENKNTKQVFKKNYKNSKRISIESVSEIGDQTATAGATDDLPKSMLLKSLGLDGLASLSLNLTIAGDDKNVVLYPSFSYLLEGKGLVDYSSVGTWYQASGRRSKGVPFSESEFTNVAALNRILQKDLVVSAIEKSLKELVEKQRQSQVKQTWMMMKK